MQDEVNLNEMSLEELMQYRLDLMSELNEVQEEVRTIKHHLEFPLDDSKEKRIRTNTALRHKLREAAEITLEIAEAKAELTKRERMTFMEVARRMLEPELFKAIQEEAACGY